MLFCYSCYKGNFPPPPEHAKGCQTNHRGTVFDYRFLRVFIGMILKLTLAYADDRPSISLTGLIPDAVGDISTPPHGRGVAVSDLLDLEARRRFGEFGRKFVYLERLRQARPIETAMSSSAKESEIKNASPQNRAELDSLYERRCVTRQFVRMYNV